MRNHLLEERLCRGERRSPGGHSALCPYNLTHFRGFLCLRELRINFSKRISFCLPFAVIRALSASASIFFLCVLRVSVVNHLFKWSTVVLDLHTKIHDDATTF